MRHPTQEEFDQWRADPLTQQFLLVLQQRREEIKDNLIRGNFWDDGDALDVIGQKCLMETAKAEILEDIIQMDHESFTGLLKEAEGR